VHGGDFHFAGIHGIEYAREQAEPNAMAEFGVVKAQLFHFEQHGPTVGVAVGIPAC
jgi:hypothetical protein